MRVALVIAASLLVACGSSVPAAAPTESTTVAATQPRSPAPSSAAPSSANASATIASGTVMIEMAEHFFSPSFLTVKVGTTVVWKVVGIQSHDVHARDGSFDSPLMAPGNTFTYTFNKVGKFPYYCAPHEGDGMFGEIDVVN